MVTGKYLFPDSERYASLLASLGQESADRLFEEALPLTELELQSLWFDGAFGRHFVSVIGQPVEIVQFGHWNHSAGPDFVDAAVRIGDEVRPGAIELDPDARDWEHHGHGENPAYNQVVLHLFFQTGSSTFFTRTEDHRDVCQVRLDPSHPSLAEVPPLRQAEAHLGRCSYVFTHLAHAKVIDILKAAAQYRLERKARHLHATAEIHGADQALFQGVAEALGYRQNRLPMRVLSQRALLSILQKRSPEGMDALLFGLAGFLEGDRHVESTHPDVTEYQRLLWSMWWQERDTWLPDPQRAPRWKTGGSRPQNHPQRRLGALGQLAAAWASFADIALAQPLDVKRAGTFLERLHHPFWDHHYTLKSKRTVKPMALIGRARVHDILANQLIPLRLHDAPEDVWQIYVKLPAVLDNEKLRRATHRLFGEHPRRVEFTKYLYQQQALLQVYDDLCLPDQSDCEDCPFPEQAWELAQSGR